MAAQVSASAAASFKTKTGTQLDGMISVDPTGIGAEWSSLVDHMTADWNSGLTASQLDSSGQPLFPTFASKISVAAAQLWAGLSSYSNAQQDHGSGLIACVNLTAAAFTSSGAQQVMLGLSSAGLSAGAAALSEIAQNAAKKIVGNVLSDAGKVIGDVGAAATCTGIGAVVGVAAGLVGGILSAVFGSPPPPAFSVGNCGLSDKPKIVCKYAWTYGDVSDGGPGNPNWRHFPDRTRKGDAGWFNAYTSARSGQTTIITAPGYTKPVLSPSSTTVSTDYWTWDGSRTRAQNEQWFMCGTYPQDNNTRPIDHAMYDNGHDGAYGADGQDPGGEYPVFRHLEQELLCGSITGIPAADFADFRRFQEAFFKAWQQNREFSLNGCKMQPDWAILDKVISIWNQSNSPSSTLRIPAPKSQPTLLTEVLTTAPPKVMSSYIQYLLYRYNNSMASVQGADGAIVLNMGRISDITVGGLLPAGSMHMLALHLKTAPKPVVTHLLKLGVAPAAIQNLNALALAKKLQAPPKRRYFFGATLAGAGVGAVAGGPAGAVVGGGVGVAVDLLRAHHEEKGKWL